MQTPILAEVGYVNEYSTDLEGMSHDDRMHATEVFTEHITSLIDTPSANHKKADTVNTGEPEPLAVELEGAFSVNGLSLVCKALLSRRHDELLVIHTGVVDPATGTVSFDRLQYGTRSQRDAILAGDVMTYGVYRHATTFPTNGAYPATLTPQGAEIGTPTTLQELNNIAKLLSSMQTVAVHPPETSWRSPKPIFSDPAGLHSVEDHSDLRSTLHPGEDVPQIPLLPRHGVSSIHLERKTRTMNPGTKVAAILALQGSVAPSLASLSSINPANVKRPDFTDLRAGIQYGFMRTKDNATLEVAAIMTPRMPTPLQLVVARRNQDTLDEVNVHTYTLCPNPKNNGISIRCTDLIMPSNSVIGHPDLPTCISSRDFSIGMQEAHSFPNKLNAPDRLVPPREMQRLGVILARKIAPPSTNPRSLLASWWQNLL